MGTLFYGTQFGCFNLKNESSVGCAKVKLNISIEFFRGKWGYFHGTQFGFFNLKNESSVSCAKVKLNNSTEIFRSLKNGDTFLCDTIWVF